MKKSFFFISFAFLLFASNVTYADSFNSKSLNNNNLFFEITSGIDTQKETLTTFDKNRTITGIAPKGSEMSITVMQKVGSQNNKDIYKETYKYSLTVGASGYFKQSISLLVGENLVVISLKKDDKQSSFSTIIKRKKSEIKSELESNIVLPISRK